MNPRGLLGYGLGGVFCLAGGTRVQPGERVYLSTPKRASLTELAKRLGGLAFGPGLVMSPHPKQASKRERERETERESERERGGNSPPQHRRKKEKNNAREEGGRERDTHLDAVDAARFQVGVTNPESHCLMEGSRVLPWPRIKLFGVWGLWLFTVPQT